MLELKKVITLEWIEVEKSFHNTRQRYCTAIIRQVFILPRWKFASTNQKHYLVLGSDTSSVWNLCTRFPDVISRSGGNQWWRHEMLVVFSGKKVACEQALLFERVKRVSRERASERRSLGPSAPRSRVLARLASLAQIGELARRLGRKGIVLQFPLQERYF